MPKREHPYLKAVIKVITGVGLLYLASRLVDWLGI